MSNTTAYNVKPFRKASIDKQEKETDRTDFISFFNNDDEIFAIKGEYSLKHPNSSKILVKSVNITEQKIKRAYNRINRKLEKR